MDNLSVVVALITRDNDYQLEQAAFATEAAGRLGIDLQVIYADNDAVNQTQQLVKIIQDSVPRPTAILVEPVGTGMPQVAKAAVSAGIGWGVLNRQPEYISELRQGNCTPVFSVSTNQEEVGRIQGKQVALLVPQGDILYIEGPSGNSVSTLRTKGLLSTKPSGVAMKFLRGDWTEQSAQRAVKSWLSLSISRDLQIRAVVCQNDAMAMGARKAFADMTNWRNTPLLGCDGVTATGQEWVRRKLLTATVITPPTAGAAVEIFAKAIRTGAMPPELTLTAARSFPALEDLPKHAPPSPPP
jgi:ABC-type sugar transport system substrate-binding protein